MSLFDVHTIIALDKLREIRNKDKKMFDIGMKAGDHMNSCNYCKNVLDQVFIIIAEHSEGGRKPKVYYK